MKPIMGFELRVDFADPQWYADNREQVSAFVQALPSVVKEASPKEYWLKASKDPWPYDLRIFIKPDALALDVIGFTGAFQSDVKLRMMEWISSQTKAVLVDDDGEPV